MFRTNKRSQGNLAVRLVGKRVTLRPILEQDFEAWREVRRSNVDWLTEWEPLQAPNGPDFVEDREAFRARCATRARARQLGTSFGFGVFVDGQLVGETNLNSVQRGPLQSAYLGYWIAKEAAGNGYCPESVACVLRHAFEDLELHRVQISIIPRNLRSIRVVEKLAVRDEGLAQRYLQINGVWEDHLRFAMTAEEWTQRREELSAVWLD